MSTNTDRFHQLAVKEALETITLQEQLELERLTVLRGLSDPAPVFIDWLRQRAEKWSQPSVIGNGPLSAASDARVEIGMQIIKKLKQLGL